MTSKPGFVLLDSKSRAVFYKSPGLQKSTDWLPAKLTYSTQVLRYAVQGLPSGANGSPVGFAYVATQSGAVIAVQALTGDCLGIIERGPRGWARRFHLERQARKRAEAEREELVRAEKVAAMAAEILKEN